VLDFTSALYLDFRHASCELRPWEQLTTGVPAALAEPVLARKTAAQMARLTGMEAGVFARSTLHAFWDLVLVLARSRTLVLLDSATYPVARWGVERAAGRGVAAAAFTHHQVDHLWRLARQATGSGRVPLIVVDGVCPSCERRAPLLDYLDIADRLAGRLLVDDTQALGLLGPEGGGSLRDVGTTGPAVVVASLAKAFGAPLAFVGGTRADIATYLRESETRVHLSPPSLADLHAAHRAVRLNACQGAARRSRLRALVERFRRGLLALGLGRPSAGRRALLPVQTVPPLPGISASDVYQRLLNLGIRGVLHKGCDGRAQVSLILSAAHTEWHVDQALQALATAC
jgi:8-amino-7-oxononanoate synthase